MPSEAPEYRIENLADFAKVPADRMETCLSEFGEWIALHRATEEMLRAMLPDHPADQPIVKAERFIWIDDGERNVTTTITDPLGDVLRVHVPGDGSEGTIEMVVKVGGHDDTDK